MNRLVSLFTAGILLVQIGGGMMMTAYAELECGNQNQIACEDYHRIMGDNPKWDTRPINGGDCGANVGGPADANWNIALVGPDNELKAFNYFLSRGLSVTQAAAILGNLKQESGVNPRSDQPNGPGMGIAQWSQGGRWDKSDHNMTDFAAGKYVPEAKGDLYGLLTQLNFIWYELNNVGQFKVAFSEFKKETSLPGMVDVFMNKYEIAGIPGPRVTLAQEALKHYQDWLKGGGKSSGAVTSGTSDTCSSTGGTGISGNFAFPQITTQEIIKTAKPYPWCYTSQTSCHHDYFAADIISKQGTVNIVAVAGTVVKATDTACNPSVNPYDVPRVQIKGSDGKYYYYTHMKPGSIKVHAGQSVAMGAQLGVVGPPECGQGTEHLHFQISNVPITNTNDPNEQKQYINPQPNLIAAFNKLPVK